MTLTNHDNAVPSPHETTPAPAGEAQRQRELVVRDFTYLLNAMERAAQEENPSQHGYGEKREAVFAFVQSLADDLYPLAPAYDPDQPCGRCGTIRGAHGASHPWAPPAPRSSGGAEPQEGTTDGVRCEQCARRIHWENRLCVDCALSERAAPGAAAEPTREEPHEVELRELARNATPGPWRVEQREAGRRTLNVVESRAYSDEEPGVCGGHSSAWPLTDYDAEYIAACSPPTILALLDALAALRATVAAAEARETALREDAERWRFVRGLLSDGGAVRTPTERFHSVRLQENIAAKFATDAAWPSVDAIVDAARAAQSPAAPSEVPRDATPTEDRPNGND